jgi:hypothetical protein
MGMGISGDIAALGAIRAPTEITTVRRMSGENTAGNVDRRRSIGTVNPSRQLILHLGFHRLLLS